MKFRLACLWGSASLGLAATPAAAEVPHVEARAIFAQAKTICEADAGRFWGVSLCGPILLVDYTDKSFVANQADADGQLRREGELYLGTAPEGFVIASTATDWSGVRWTQLVYPFHFDGDQRPVTLAHEMFHRVQAPLGLTRPEAANGHLDTLDGRYLIQLEWRALAATLTAKDDAAKETALADAMAFRQERYRLFPAAATEEAALEISEGVPEYMGVMLGLPSKGQRIDYALRDLSAFVASPTLVRSFAYASGPALGLLLDDYAPTWRRGLNQKARLHEMLIEAAQLTQLASGDLRTRAAVYDAHGGLRSFEEQREMQRQVRLAELRARLIEGPAVILPVIEARCQFNPQTLIGLDHGTVFPTLQLVAAWGVLEVKSGGAFFDRPAKQMRVSTKGASQDHLSGDGWSLTLKPGWTIAPGDRPGDVAVTRAAHQ